MMTLLIASSYPMTRSQLSLSAAREVRVVCQAVDRAAWASCVLPRRDVSRRRKLADRGRDPARWALQEAADFARERTDLARESVGLAPGWADLAPELADLAREPADHPKRAPGL